LIEEASGDFILFHPPYVVSKPDRIMKLMESMDEKLLAVGSSYITIYPNGTEKPEPRNYSVGYEAIKFFQVFD